MASQSQPIQSDIPYVLLTRPAAQSQRFARSLRHAFLAPLHVMISPLMQPMYMQPERPLPVPGGLIFSSETGVLAYARLATRPVAPAWCVGNRTAQAAKNAGLEPVLVATDVADLLAQMRALRPLGPFLHVRGRDSTGDVTHALMAAGIPATETILYDQRPMPLAPRALRLLQGPLPVVVPVFSPRSMRLLCAAAPPNALLRFVALSPAVASAISHPSPAQIAVCQRPDAQSMLNAVLSLLRQPSLP